MRTLSLCSISFFLTMILVLLSAAPLASAQVMESGSYKIERDSVNGGGGLGTSASYVLESTAGEAATGESSSATYVVQAGYQQSGATSIVTPPDEEDEGGGVTGGLTVRIISLEIIEGTTSGILRYTTSVPVKSTLSWGAGTSYELGSHTESIAMREHTIIITGLLPAAEYFFRIDGKPGFGFSQTLLESSFVTLPYPDIGVPGNIRNFTARADGEDVVLAWKNPYDIDFAYVRVFGSDEWYPEAATSGFLYEGDGERAVDLGKVIPNTTRYYSAFAYDADGNISSGAIVAITFDADGAISVIDFDERSFTEVPLSISLDDFIFIQKNKVIQSNDGVVSLDGSRALVVMLPYDKVPEHLKSLIMTIESNDGSGNSFSFLLRVNDDKTAYTAAIAPLGITGAFPFSVALIDYKVKQMGKVEGVFASRIIPTDDPSVLSMFTRLGYLPYFIVTLLVLLVIAYRLIRGKWY